MQTRMYNDSYSPIRRGKYDTTTAYTNSHYALLCDPRVPAEPHAPDPGIAKRRSFRRMHLSCDPLRDPDGISAAILPGCAPQPSAYGGHHFASSCSAASHLLSYSPQRPSINAVGRCLHDLSQLREYDHSAGYGYAWYRLCRLYLSLHRHSDDVYLDPWSKRSHWKKKR